MTTATPEELDAKLRQDHPTLKASVNGVDVTLNRDQYEARIAEMVVALVAAQERKQEEAEAQAERDALLADLDAGKATSEQVQFALASLLRNRRP